MDFSKPIHAEAYNEEDAKSFEKYLKDNGIEYEDTSHIARYYGDYNTHIYEFYVSDDDMLRKINSDNYNILLSQI